MQFGKGLVWKIEPGVAMASLLPLHDAFPDGAFPDGYC